MNIKIVIFIVLLIFCEDLSRGQAQRLKYLGIDAGMTFMESEISNMEYIRGSISSYYTGYSTNSVTSFSYRSFIGIKTEILSLNDRFGLLGGLRLSFISGSTGKSDYWTSNTNYFYWLYSQDGIQTEYLKVKEINQKSNLIGIPIEIRYFTGRRPRVFQFYVKLGFEINYLMKSKTDIVFYNSAMEPYEKYLIAMNDQPSNINTAVYSGAGFKFGRDQKPSISIEACMPYFLMSSRSLGMLKPLYGGGFQFNFQIPVKSKEQ